MNNIFFLIFPKLLFELSMFCMIIPKTSMLPSHDNEKMYKISPQTSQSSRKQLTKNILLRNSPRDGKPHGPNL